MTDETKKLFDAPWTVCLEKRGSFYRPCIVAGDTKIASVSTKENANRFVRLPELYDALKEAIEEACQDCVEETYQRTGMLFEPSTDGCIYPERDCCPKCRSWIELLRNVRGGSEVSDV